MACGDPAVGPWLAGFLAPEGITVEDYVHALRAIGRPWEVVTAFDAAPSATERADADVLLVERLEVDADVLDSVEGIRTLVLFGRDIAGIDEAACAYRSIRVHTTDRRTTAGVADHVIMLLLVLVRRFLDGARLAPGQAPGPVGGPLVSFEAGGHPPTVFNWLAVPGIRPLAGRRLAVVGAGEVGQAVLARAGAFGMELGYTSRTRRPELERQLGVRRLAMEDVAGWADVVSLHLAYTPTLRHLVDDTFLRALGPEGILINTARGLLVDHVALVEALHDGTVGGAGLDVFPTEPLPADDPLRTAPHVALTPHVGGGNRWELVEEIAALVASIEEVTAP